MDHKVILIVDDNQAEIEIVKEAIGEVYPNLSLLSVNSGEGCLAVLRHIGQWADTAKPDMILLDLNMPGSNGFAILSKIKSDPNLCHIPVIIFSTSKAEKDVLDAHRLYANSYVAKPLGYEELKDMFRHLLHYWLQVAKIPGTHQFR